MMNNKILENIQDEYVTESELINKLNITHEKLKEDIKKLEETGYEINIDDDKGLKLEEAPDILEPYEIKRGLESKYIGHCIHFYDEVESTSDTAREYLENNAEEGTVIIAGRQTAGRSRKKDDWASPEGGIYMTMILKPDITLTQAPKLTIVTGVAIAKTLHDHFNIDVGIKWPNDILIEKKKICGILTEGIGEYDQLDAVLIGIGIDVNMSENKLPDDVQNVATTIKEEVNTKINRAEIIRVFFKVFEELYEKYQDGEFKYIVSEWRRLSATTGNRVKVYTNGRSIYADAVGIDNEGFLIVETDEGELEKITSGRVLIID